MKWLKKNWFKILMYGILLLVAYSWITYLASNIKMCGWDDFYDNNCGDVIYDRK